MKIFYQNLIYKFYIFQFNFFTYSYKMINFRIKIYYFKIKKKKSFFYVIKHLMESFQAKLKQSPVQKMFALCTNIS